MIMIDARDVTASLVGRFYAAIESYLEYGDMKPRTFNITFYNSCTRSNEVVYSVTVDPSAPIAYISQDAPLGRLTR